jgi:hypothetical protein
LVDEGFTNVVAGAFELEGCAYPAHVENNYAGQEYCLTYSYTREVTGGQPENTVRSTRFKRNLCDQLMGCDGLPNLELFCIALEKHKNSLTVSYHINTYVKFKEKVELRTVVESVQGFLPEDRQAHCRRMANFKKLIAYITKYDYYLISTVSADHYSTFAKNTLAKHNQNIQFPHPIILNGTDENLHHEAVDNYLEET